MSWVASVLLFLGVEEGMNEIDLGGGHYSVQEIVPEGVERLNAWLARNQHGSLVKLTDHLAEGGDDRAFQAEVYGGAFNYLDLEAFLACIQEQHWRNPGSVQVLIKDEEDDQFTLYGVPPPTLN